MNIYSHQWLVNVVNVIGLLPIPLFSSSRTWERDTYSHQWFTGIFNCSFLFLFVFFFIFVKTFFPFNLQKRNVVRENTNSKRKITFSKKILKRKGGSLWWNIRWERCHSTMKEKVPGYFAFVCKMLGITWNEQCFLYLCHDPNSRILLQFKDANRLCAGFVLH